MNSVIKKIVLDMIEILIDGDKEERIMAADTLREALFPKNIPNDKSSN